MEMPHRPAEVRVAGALRSSPGAGAVLGPGGERLRVGRGSAAAVTAGGEVAGAVTAEGGGGQP